MLIGGESVPSLTCLRRRDCEKDKGQGEQNARRQPHRVAAKDKSHEKRGRGSRGQRERAEEVEEEESSERRKILH